MGQCCSCRLDDAAVVQHAAAQESGKTRSTGQAGKATGQRKGFPASAETPIAVRASSVSSVTPSAVEKRHRSVAASPTRFFELLAEPSAKLRTEMLHKASMEYAASGDLATLQPDTPQHSVRSLLNALLLKQNPNQDATILQDMCGDAWIPRSSLTQWHTLGEGAFATVQQCMLKQENLPLVPVAVKKLKSHVLSNAVDLREFLSEANTLRRLKHKHIVEFKGVGCMEPHSPETMTTSLYIVQEYMPGSTLKVHVLHQMFPHNSSPVHVTYTWIDALRWLQQIAAALKYLHSLRPMVVHRDLKLENMLLTGLDPSIADAKLADFGLCKLVKDTAGAVPFVPGTQGGSSLSLPGMSPGPGQGNGSRSLGGQPLGAPQGQPHRADDSAKADPSHGSDSEATGSSRVSVLGNAGSHKSSAVAGSRKSSAVAPTEATSVASSSHSNVAPATVSAAASSRASAMSSLKGLATSSARSSAIGSASGITGKVGQVLADSVPAEGLQPAIAPANPAVGTSNGPAAGTPGGSGVMPPQWGQSQHMGVHHHRVDEKQAHSQQAGVAGSSQHAATALTAAPMTDTTSTDAAIDTVPALHTSSSPVLPSEQGQLAWNGASQKGSNGVSSQTGSVQSTSGVTLTSVSMAGQSDKCSSPSAQDAALTPQGAPDTAPGLPQAAPGPSGMTSELAQAASAAAQAAPAFPQTGLSPFSAIAMQQAALSEQNQAGKSQRPNQEASVQQPTQSQVEEQEVLYNMTGQTGSLMYMAPEVSNS